MPADATFELPTYRLADAQARVAKYARKAAKLGQPAPSLEIVCEYDRTWLLRFDGRVVAGPFDGFAPLLDDEQLFAASLRRDVVRMTRVTITGARPIIAGWEFAATIEHTDAGNFVWAVPGGSDLPRDYRKADATYCDKCKLHRLRNKTYVVQSVAKPGTYKRVGSTCLQDFLGDADPSVWMHAFTLLQELESFEIGDDYGEAIGGREAEEVGVATFLACVSMFAREFGYVSAKAAYDGVRATGSLAFGALTNVKTREVAFKELTASDFARAAAALAWLSEQAVDADNDYMHNLRLAATMNVSPRTCKLVASLLPAHDRELSKRAVKAAKVNEYFAAEPGERPVLDLTVERMGGYYTDFGYTHVITLVSDKGLTFVWKTSSPNTVADERFDIGDTFRVVARVEDFSDYRGTKQTRLSRCRLHPANSDDKKLGAAARKFSKQHGTDAPEWAWTAAQKKRAA